VRIVLDINVLISALISKQGAPALLIDVWDDDRFTLVSSAEQLEEFKTEEIPASEGAARAASPQALGVT
jgi:predicted nucleic acid-binding protein